MFAFAMNTPGAAALGSAVSLSAWREREPRFFALGLLLVLLMVPTLFAFSIDGRQFNDINIWDKPLRFEFALVVYALTLAFFARFLSPGMTNSRWYRFYSGLVVAAIVVEMIWIGGGAALGVPSHFNTTPLGIAIYGFMGLAATLLTSAAAVYAVAIAFNRHSGLSPALKEGLVIGLGLVLPLTLMTAGTMSGMGGHWIGGAESDANGLALLGWARDGGDLRVAHFFAVHALHFIPAFALLSAWFWNGDNPWPTRLFGIAYTALVVFTFRQALAGDPFLAMLG